MFLRSVAKGADVVSENPCSFTLTVTSERSCGECGMETFSCESAAGTVSVRSRPRPGVESQLLIVSSGAAAVVSDFCDIGVTIGISCC